MIKNMLQAASKMLSQSKEEKVICAKIIIDEIISSFEGDAPILGEIIPIPNKPKGRPKKEANYPEPEVGVKDNKLVTIKNVPLDGIVELDGVPMTHEEAIGKRFSAINILWRP